MFPAFPENTTLVRLRAQARHEASRLRREAVDDFWRGADAIWERGLSSAQRQVQRSATRLNARLDRRGNRSLSSTSKKA